MSCYRVSNAVCEELDGRMADFWWGEVGDRRRIHWRSWSRLCLPKEEGGLGFRDFKAFNQALLAKQCWRILMQPELLISRLLKGKYFPSQCFLNTTKRSNPSWGWQSILHGRDLLMQGLLWKLGSHLMLSIFERPWIPRNGVPSLPILSHPLPHGIIIQISSLCPNGEWDKRILSHLFDQESVRIILSIPLPRTPQSDHPIWFYSARGEYSTSSGYSLALRLRPPKKKPPSLAAPTCSALWGSVWDLHLQPKLRFSYGDSVTEFCLQLSGLIPAG
ncbi:Uncharacterized mitochondrial protein AtMg00310 [Linum perenne]